MTERNRSTSRAARRLTRRARIAAVVAAGLIGGTIGQVGLGSPASAAACAGGSDFAVAPLHSPVFYIDPGDALVGNYAGYSITNNTGAAVSDLWVTLDSFAGGSLALASHEDGVVQVGSLAAGATETVFFYLASSAIGTVVDDQTLKVNLFDARPNLPGASELCDAGDTFTEVDAVISANANKVNTVVSGPSPAELGGVMTITVTGETGTVGAAGIFAATPAAYAEWRADAYQLVGTTIDFHDLSISATDDLYFTGITLTAYTAVYTFVATAVTGSPTAVSPIANISSGTQIKHTSTGTFGDLAPVLPAESSLTIAMTASPALHPSGVGGTTTFTVTMSNAGTATAWIDDVVGSLPTGTSYLGNQTFGGSPTSPPVIVGQTATFVGPFAVPAGGTATLTFDLTIPGVDDTYTTSAVGHVGSEQIDTTLTTADDEAAVAHVSVGDPPADLSVVVTAGPNPVVAGGTLTYTVEVTNAGDGDAADVQSTFVAPSNGSIVSTSGCAEDPNGVPTCTLGSIGAGQTESYTITVSVDGGASGTVDASAAVSTSSDDVDPSNDDAALSVDVTADIALSLTKTFSGSEVTAGTTGHQFEIEVANGGSSPAPGVRVTDTVDPRLTVSSVACPGAVANVSAGQSIDCTFDIAAAGSASIVVDYSVQSGVDTATVLNTASADDGEGHTASDDASISVIEDVELTGSKTFDVTTVERGSNSETFEISVQNQGLSTAEDVTITDVVNPALGVVSTDCVALGGTEATVANTVACTFAALGAGASVTLTVTYDVPVGSPLGAVANIAAFSSDEFVAQSTNTASVTVVDVPVVDSDNDGIPDSVEGTADTDGDSTPDRLDLDSDNDGVPDSVEATTDTDGDSTPDRLDLDSDNDGVPDLVEAGGPDTNRDGVVDGFVDTNDDGLSDDLAVDPLDDIDSDNDGTPDRREIDADNDGLLDAVESGYPVGPFTPGSSLNPVQPIDSDNDGLADFRELDSDGDGILDAGEATTIVVTGQVLDQATGRAVAGAVVTLVDSAGRSFQVTTGADGRFRFESTPAAPIAAGSVTLTATANGYTQALGSITAVFGQVAVRTLALAAPPIVPGLTPGDATGVLAFSGGSSLLIAAIGFVLIGIGCSLARSSRARHPQAVSTGVSTRRPH